MKVSNFNSINSFNIQKRTVENNPSFKGIVSGLGSVNQKLMHTIETGGFFAEFCLMDLCGLVLPRVFQGFNRNKEELGHWNFQAGMEELIREGTTGPSMFLIPIGAVILAGKAMGKGTQIASNLLGKFSNIFKNSTPEVINSDNAKKAFANGIFDSITSNIKDTDLASQKQRFTELLTDSVGQKLTRKEAKEKLGAFVNYMTDLNAKFFHEPKTTLVNLHEGATKMATSASDLFLDARKYMEDLIPSVQKTLSEDINSGKTLTKDIVNNVIDKLTNIRHNGRKLLCIGGTAALAAFLCIIPRLYQLSKKNPALEGLEKNNNTTEAKKC